MTVPRNEALALDADVLSVRLARADHQPSTSAWGDREDLPALLVGRDQVAGESPEPGRCNRDSAFHPRRAARQRVHGAVAANRVHGRRLPMIDRHQQPVAEVAGLIESDAVDQTSGGDRGELANAARADCDQATPWRRKPQGVHGALPEAAATVTDGGHRDVRLETGGGAVSRSEGTHGPVGTQERKPACGGQHHRAVAPRPGDVHGAGRVD